MNNTATHHTTGWHVLGLGAIGGLFACRMSAAGIPVAGCPSPSTTTTTTLELTLEEHGDTRKFTLPVDREAPISQLLLTTKAHQSETALANIEHRLRDDATIVVLQNGLGVHERLLARWPTLAIVAATTTEGVNRPALHHLRHAGHGTTWLGPWRDEDGTCAHNVFHQWRRMDMSLQFDAHITERLWEKLVMNCAINPLTALLDCHNGALEAQAETREVMHAVVNEVCRLMQVNGMTADSHALYQKVLAVSRSTATNISSMLADHRAGRATEIDFINGYVARASRAHGLATPVNDWLVDCMQTRQSFEATALLAAMPGRAP